MTDVSVFIYVTVKISDMWFRNINLIPFRGKNADFLSL